ncbi:MAG TPA: hypothetical protein VKE94_23825 [Gemmataceae bacterium]|nr:hypothetical protein [Gemmataceae bacterium]
MVLLMFTIVTGCSKHSRATASKELEQSLDSLEARIDRHGDAIVASAAKAEARQWMNHPSHLFFKANSKEVGRFVEEFYAAGASQVVIADIEEHEGKQFGEGLLVVLPREPSARSKLFEIGARAAAAFQDDPVTDKGQKYLYYSLD